MEYSQKKIELRSEKVRNIIGQVPNLLLRKGITIISLVIIGLIFITYFLPYSEVVSVRVHIYTIPQYEIITASNNGRLQFDQLQKVNQLQILGYLKSDRDSVVIIKSPIDGTVIENCSNNSIVKKDDILFLIAPKKIEEIYATGIINTKNIYKIALGQKVKISSRDHLLHDRELIGKISKIYPIPDSNSNFKIRITILPSDQGQASNPISLFEGDSQIVISDTSIFKKIISFFD